MEERNLYILLIEHALAGLTSKYKTVFKYEIQKVTMGYSFTIFQKETPVYHKEILASINIPEFTILTHLHYQVVRDLIDGGIERSIMQKENELKLFPKRHTNDNNSTYSTTMARW